MECLDGVVKEIGILREELEELRLQIVERGFVPIFTQRMMWAFLIISLCLLLSSLGILYGNYILSTKVHTMLNEIHNIYTLLE